MAEAISKLFKNFTDKEFVCSWDGVAYRFPPGKEMYVEDWKAEHFANHLVNRVMHEKGMITTNKVERDGYLAQAMPSDEEPTPEIIEEQVKSEVLEKKSVKKEKVVEEEEFIGKKK